MNKWLCLHCGTYEMVGNPSCHQCGNPSFLEDKPEFKAKVEQFEKDKNYFIEEIATGNVEQDNLSWIGFMMDKYAHEAEIVVRTANPDEVKEIKDQPVILFYDTRPLDEQ